MVKELDVGSIRIKSKDLKSFKKVSVQSNSSDVWEFFSDLDLDVVELIDLYNSNDNFDLLLDLHDDSFLRGSLTPDLRVSGARVMVLPDGRKLARAGFSLFAKDLLFNFGKGSDKSKLWDVCYTNASGSKTYLYSEDKVHLEQDKKLKLVNSFEDNYLNILESCEKKIKSCDCDDFNLKYFGLYVLLNSFIRVGNLEYFKRYGHKGLTTLMKKDISFDNNFVAFDFIGKDGVPQSIEKEFPDFFVSKFKEHVDSLKSDDSFVFMRSNGHVLHSDDFSRILFGWTGEHFYPHIIRSHHADMVCKEFLKHHRKANKKEVEDVFLSIASDLGHKKFNKKTNNWDVNFSVTLKNYIHPKFSEKMINLYSKK